MPSLPNSAAVFAFVFLFAIGPASSAGFSRPDWSNPAQAGSALWIKNDQARDVTLDSLYVRTLGFRGFGEVAFKAGPSRVCFALQRDPRGHWARLIPKGKPVRFRVRAKDSLMISGFECGARLQGAPDAKRAAEEFVLDLMFVDNSGERDQVKISQLTPSYRIEDAPNVVSAEPGGD